MGNPQLRSLIVKNEYKLVILPTRMSIQTYKVHNRTSRGFNCDIWVALDAHGDIIAIRVYKYLNMCITGNLSDGIYMHPNPSRPLLSWSVNSSRNKFGMITTSINTAITGEINYKFSKSGERVLDHDVGTMDINMSPKVAKLLANIRKYGLRNAGVSTPEPSMHYEAPRRILQAVSNARRLVDEPQIISRMDLDAHIRRSSEEIRNQRVLKYVDEMFDKNNN